jgi:hypothetical protein
VEEYRQFCKGHSFDSSIPTLCSVGAFLVVRTRRLGGSTATVDSTIGAIRRQTEMDGLPEFLSRREQLLLLDLVKELKYNDKRGVHRVRPLSRLLLDLIYRKGKHGRGWRERMAIVMMTVAHDGMLRAGEICSGLRAVDLSWNISRTTVTITLLRTKRYRTGSGQLVTLCDYGKGSGCALLREWMLECHIPDGSTAYLFPEWEERSHAFNCRKSVCTDNFRKMLKRAVASIGLEPSTFSGHSCRAGGATDAFNAGVAYATVKKFGRWRSDTVLLYYRDEEEVVSRIMDAFGRLSTRRSSLQGRRNV